MSNFINLSVKTKLITSFVIMFSITLFVGIYANFGMSRLGDSLELIGNRRLMDALTFSGLNKERMVIRAQTLSVLIQEAEDNPQAAYAKILEDRNHSWHEIDKDIDYLNSHPRSSDKGKQLKSEFDSNYLKWREIYERIDAQILSLSHESDSLMRDHLLKDYRQLIKEMVPISNQMGLSLDSLVKNNTNNTKAIVNQMDHYRDNLSHIFYAVLGLGLALGSLLSFLTCRGITRPLTTIQETLKNLAAGDFRNIIGIHRHDEFGEIMTNLDTMVLYFRKTIHTIQTNSKSLSASAIELDKASASLTSQAKVTDENVMETKTNTTKTQNEISSIANTTEEISASSNIVAKSVNQLNTSFQHVLAGCQREQQVVKTTQELTSESQKQIELLEDTTNAIAQILDMINSIAEQTNLLALNATIEAASAGEAGKGFSVVAGEIKELSRQTANATSEIEQRIEMMLRNTKSSVLAIQKVTNAIADVRIISEETLSSVTQQMSSVTEINSNLVQLNQGIQEVTRSVSESVTSIRKISNSAHNIERSSVQTTLSAKQVNQSADQLALSSQDLFQQLEYFKT